MKSLVFDSSAIISIVTNDLLWSLSKLKEKFKGQFYIPEGIKEELIIKPLDSKKYKLEAIQVLSEVNKGILEIYSNPRVKERAKQIADRANNLIRARGNWITLVSQNDMECLALAEYLNSDALIVDERTLRLLVEDPKDLVKLFERKLHSKIEVNKDNLDFFKDEFKKINILRSTELMSVGFEIGVLDDYLKQNGAKVEIDLKKNLLEGLLWGLKLRGCAISEDEIEDIMKYYR
ncbi:MAG: hypothetical protein PHE43_01860 [Candidatus Nanoarchaeia archaeon]|nr:hypothetical protein [Candidatus Nanoarchaeia archaeon]